MDREDIIRMAREAGFSERDAMGRTAFLGNSYDIERFAALVAAHEREACAKAVEDYCGAWDKREWVGLTDEEIQDLSYLSQKIDEGNAAWFDRLGFARAIEAKLKEKNT